MQTLILTDNAMKTNLDPPFAQGLPLGKSQPRPLRLLTLLRACVAAFANPLANKSREVLEAYLSSK
jgi:hypothetical protein